MSTARTFYFGYFCVIIVVNGHFSSVIRFFRENSCMELSKLRKNSCNTNQNKV